MGAPKKTTKKVAVESFTRRMEGDKERISTDEIDILEFVTEPAVITVEYGVTVNLGNYESAKVHQGIRVPCYAEEIDEASAWADNWVKDKIAVEVAAIKDKDGK